ncbi:DUF3124 domain-containing protein [Flammeovirga kamogawensis]|uniref:DUF3124 domain-containing protein n=1 Tax=Flammeovirga kamogawensis TaxID=373891 RepID=A0ABX8GR50_9BACT|nr:DUF3124 domain-containing protein [Flammeovirga kamogawensis]MBB6462727.1 hypothetical protein [Flammeovirga kamogawensis]QWG06040.1 DUF3124 domain-containing protein [Flammeovirga kamogawensis]TRX67872.1 DUF3124 domain-containing protein [Flammeovirga kamogawensis]
MKKLHNILLLLGCLSFLSCQKEISKDELVLRTEERNHNYISASETPTLNFKEKYYVSAYSDLYYQQGNTKFRCTVVLSLRNVSETETLYVTDVKYYDSKGKLLRDYVKENLILKPLESAEYLVEQQEREGGVGANFIVEYGAENTPKNKALIEAINIGNFGRYGFSFKSDAILLKE